MSDKPGLSRKFLLWFLRYPPFTPYVSVSCAIDLTEMCAYLARLNADGDAPRVSLQHLVSAALARTYRAFPMANATVIGQRIVRHEHVGVVMPVNLLGRGSEQLETGLVLVERAEELSLRELAAKTRRRVDAERAAKPHNLFLRAAMPIAQRIPQSVLHGFLDAADFAVRLPWLGRRLHDKMPATTCVSNAGAAVPLPAGTVTRAVAFSPPDRLLAIGSVLAVFPAQDEVIAIDGEAVVRPMLPLGYTFDHRLFDGVMSGRILGHMAELLTNPEGTFGPTGDSHA